MRLNVTVPVTEINADWQNPATDHTPGEVAKRTDTLMYENKREIKEKQNKSH